MKVNTEKLKNIITGRLESLTDAAVADLELAAETIAVSITEAYLAGDEDSAQEAIEQLELLGEIQRIRLTNEAVAALRESLSLATSVLFASI